MKAIWLATSLMGLVALNPAFAGDFSFGIPSRLTLERNAADTVAIGDANGDGHKDLAATSVLPNGDHELSVYLQDSGGGVLPPIRLKLADQTLARYPVAFVDLDGLGADEIVVGDAASGIQVIRLAGSMLSGVRFPARRGCKFIAIGDIDADGDMDIVCHDAKSTITLFFGNGLGGIASTAEIRSSAGSFSVEDFKSIRLADVTGDGLPDLVVTSSIVDSFFVHVNNGFGGFWPPTAYVHPWSAMPVWPAAVEVLDLDGDGRNEVVTASPGNGAEAMLNIYRRGANGYLYLANRVPAYDSMTALATDDVDRDGDVDLVAGHYDFNAVSLLRGGVDGLSNQTRFELPGFGSVLDFWMSGDSSSIALGDLNGDGCEDLAGATYSGIQLLYGCRPFVSRLPVSDVNGDGVADLIWHLSTSSETYISQWAGLGGWQFCDPPGGSWWEPETIGDFDGDGNSEIFWRNRSSGANAVQYAEFQPTPLTGVTNQDWQVSGSGDFDGDDRSDLVWRNARTGANTIWKSAQSGTSQAVATVSDLRWKIVGVGDFDGDGRSDILWRNAVTGVNAIWRTGNSALAMSIPAVTNVAWQVAGVGDFNGDRTDDVLWRNVGTGANVIWLSASSSTSQQVLAVTNLDWFVASVADYDADGRSDLFWRNKSTGANVIWRSADNRQSLAVKAIDPAMTLIHQ